MIVRNIKETKKELKKLRKYLCKLYHKNNQILYITSLEEWEDYNEVLDIVAIDKKSKKFKYLFTITNLNAFNTLELRYKYYLKDHEYYTYFDSVSASFTPFYFDRHFTLKKFSTITEKDVVGCCKYFLEKVLNEFWIWNVEFIKPVEHESPSNNSD